MTKRRIPLVAVLFSFILQCFPVTVLAAVNNDADGKKLNISALKREMLVDIAYDGTVQESFPMGISNPAGIVIKSQSDDIAGLYRIVIDDLYRADSALNHNAGILAFNLNGVVNLRETEKTALIYFGRQYV